MGYDEKLKEIRNRLKSRKSGVREDYGVKGMKWGEHHAEDDPTESKSRKGTMGDQDIKQNILAEIRNRKEEKGGASSALNDLRPGDSVSLEAKTRRGNVYRTLVAATEDGSFEVTQTIKGVRGKPQKMSLEDASGEVLYFCSRTGGALDKLGVQRKENRESGVWE